MGHFQLKTKVFSGRDALRHLSDLPIRKALIVTDSYFSSSGDAARVTAQLNGAETQIFDAVKPDPTLEMAIAGEKQRRIFGADTLIALGGGSPIDCAKAIKALSDEPLLLVAIPTTSGSGSEVTSFAIITRGETKFPLIDENLLPDAAILDPSFQLHMPKGLIAETGMDLISHCLEALAAKGRNVFSDTLALQALDTAFRLLPLSYRGQTEVRAELQAAACMAGAAFQTAGLGVGHALAHALGARFHISHGRINAVLMPAVLRFNASVSAEAYRLAAQRLGSVGSTDTLLLRALIRSIDQLRRQLQLPGSLRELGIALPSDLSAITSDAMNDMCLTGNPRPVTVADLEDILREIQ